MSDGQRSEVRGKAISHCRLLEKLGGMGAVFEAGDHTLGGRAELTLIDSSTPEIASENCKPKVARQ